MLAAGNPDAAEAFEALANLCQAYWYPIYAYVRRKGHPPEQAQDLTQDFFAYVLERDLLAKADPDRGRFRGFLRIVCARRLSGDRERTHARKRGGGKTALSIDVADAEGRYSREPSHELTPERIFDRTWALTLLGRVFDQLRGEYDAAGRAAIFDELRAVLTGAPSPIRTPPSLSGWERARALSGSPSIAFAVDMASCFARRSPPPSMTPTRLTTRSARSSLRCKRKPDLRDPVTISCLTPRMIRAADGRIRSKVSARNRVSGKYW